MLQASRRRDGRSIRDLVAATEGDVTPTWLRRLERGSVVLDESMIEIACRLYGADLGAVLPARVSLAIEDRVLAIGGLHVSVERDDPTAVLTAYLRLIRALRDQKKAPAVALRRDDIERLAAHLSLDGEEVLDRLASLMGASAAQRIAIGTLFAAGAIVVGLVAVGNVDAGGLMPATTIVESTGAADTIGLAPAVRVLAPVAPTATVVTNRSGCTTDASGAVMTVSIPDISYQCPVYAGGQSQIDAGFVTLVTAAGSNAVLATEPGAPGTLWLAAHRASNGAAFADVPGLANGALVTVTDGGVTATYRVVSRSYVEVRNDQVIDAKGNATSLATWQSIIRADLGGNLAPRLVLQTCEGTRFRWMIYADLVS